ncbi:MAG: hypothetical protein M1819_000906 [Sarea resinae]|nr:MAG: hypothetical protein M1819_000906 [Sarea resinae]
MKLSYTILDVFTTTCYAGNPLAIVRVPHQLRAALTQSQKQGIAKEFNLSETVFLHEDADTGKGEVIVDVFTPEAEIPFAGHPSIGTIYHLIRQKSQPVKTLLMKAGPLSISVDNDAGLVGAEIPHNVHIHGTKLASDLSIYRECPLVSIVKGMNFILVHLSDLVALHKANQSLKRHPYQPEGLDQGWSQGFTGTYFYVPLGVDSRGRQTFRTRMLSTESEEDPATGSAASALTAYLALQESLEKGAGPFEYVLTQGVEMGRTSHIFVSIQRKPNGDGIETVTLRGTAVGVMEGTLEVD